MHLAQRAGAVGEKLKPVLADDDLEARVRALKRRRGALEILDPAAPRRNRCAPLTHPQSIAVLTSAAIASRSRLASLSWWA